MIELLVTNSLNLTTGAQTMEFTVVQDGVTVSKTHLSPVEYAQLIGQAQRATMATSYTESTGSPQWPDKSSFDESQEGHDKIDEPNLTAENVDERSAQKPPSLRSQVATAKPPFGKGPPPIVPPAPPAPGVGVKIPGSAPPSTSTKSAIGKVQRTIGAMLEKKGSMFALNEENPDEGPNASPVEASEL